MSKYKGHIENFPDEVVEWMLAQQEAQGNPRYISVFEKDRTADQSKGGFNWDEVKFPFMTLEDPHDLCTNIIEKRRFDLFLYPKKSPSSMTTPYFDEHRFQAALAAMTGLLNNGKLNHPAAIATEAVELADELWQH